MADILCFSSTDWFGKWGSRQQIMKRLAQRGHRVLFIERQVGPEHLLRYPDMRHRKWHRWQEGLRQLDENLWIVSLPLLFPGRYYAKTINRFNQKLTRRWISPYISTLNLQNPILWLYNVERVPLLGAFDEILAVYHCIDEFTAGTSGRKRRIITELEQKLLQSVDLVLANSKLTYENKRKYNAYTYRLPSGVDVEHFSLVLDDTIPVHSDMVDIPAPIAGFVGNIGDRIDISLLESVVQRLPNWHFVLIGQAYPQFVNIDPLLQHSNVHLLGKYPFDVVPHLLKRVDVCLFPYIQDDERADYRSPLKLYEYLATGRPIVSTPQPEVMEINAGNGLIAIANDPQGFARKIIDEWENDNHERQSLRIQEAKKHSWDRRVDQIEKLLNQYLGKHARNKILYPSH